jgi:ribonuclease Z
LKTLSAEEFFQVDHSPVKPAVGYHMSPVEAGEVAQEAGVKKLVLVHAVPPVENFITRRMYLAGVDDVYDGEVILGEDRLTFELPPKE